MTPNPELTSTMDEEDWERDVLIREQLSIVQVRWPEAYEYYERENLVPPFLEREDPMHPLENVAQYCAREQRRINHNIRARRAQCSFLRDHGRELSDMTETVEPEEDEEGAWLFAVERHFLTYSDI